jgi:hypothetical protein
VECRSLQILKLRSRGCLEGSRERTRRIPKGQAHEESLMRYWVVGEETFYRGRLDATHSGQREAHKRGDEDDY